MLMVITQATTEQKVMISTPITITIQTLYACLTAAAAVWVAEQG